MKKIIKIGVIAVCVVALAAVAVIAYAGTNKEQTEDIVMAPIDTTQRIEGVITEMADSYFVIQEAELGEIQVNFGEETEYEGSDPGELAVGQHVFVVFDGKMTRSLPPQVFAMRVSTYPVYGTVTAVGEDSITVEQDNDAGEAIIFLPEEAPALEVGQTIVAYTTGTMTMSLPPQMTAIEIEILN